MITIEFSQQLQIVSLTPAVFVCLSALYSKIIKREVIFTQTHEGLPPLFFFFLTRFALVGDLSS
jgi:hypothetical protein